MSDIATSLEQIKELFDEIEGLREEVAILRTTEAAEIERLRTERNKMAQRSNQLPFLLDEIERLRAALQWIADYDGPRSQSVEEVARRALEPKT